MDMHMWRINVAIEDITFILIIGFSFRASFSFLGVCVVEFARQDSIALTGSADLSIFKDRPSKSIHLPLNFSTSDGCQPNFEISKSLCPTLRQGKGLHGVQNRMSKHRNPLHHSSHSSNVMLPLGIARYKLSYLHKAFAIEAFEQRTPPYLRQKTRAVSLDPPLLFSRTTARICSWYSYADCQPCTLALWLKRHCQGHFPCIGEVHASMREARRIHH